MRRTYVDRSRIIKRITSFAKNHSVVKKIDVFCDFISLLYRTAPLDSLDAWDPKDLYGAALSLWQLVKQRESGLEQCKLFNAQNEDFPWQSDHTMVAIVTDFKPFLVDSIRMALTRAGCTVYAYINAAGVGVERTRNHVLKSICDANDDASKTREAYMLFQISYIDAEQMAHVEEQVIKVLNDVKYAVQDWRPMQSEMQLAIDELEDLPPIFPQDEVAESRAFLNWLLEYFTFIGYRQYEVQGDGKRKGLTLVKGSSLGVLQDDSSSLKHRYYCDLPEKMRAHALSHNIVLVTKTNTLSTVHRSPYTDMIVCKSFDQKGQLTGERRFIGLFTSDAYDSDPSRIPFLRKRVEMILKQAVACTGDFERKRLLHILKRLPRDELFQASLDELQSMTMGILDIQERRLTRLFARKDICNRFVSCLVYVPRDNYSTELRIRMQRVLMEAFQGREILATPMFSESSLAAVHFVIRIDTDQDMVYDIDKIEFDIAQLARSWLDEFAEELLCLKGSAESHRLLEKYRWAFSPSFKSLYSGKKGAEYVSIMENMDENDGLHVELTASDKQDLLLRIFQSDHLLPLSDAIPLLENMGLRIIGERVFEIKKTNDEIVFISEFMIEYLHFEQALASPRKEIFCQSLRHIWQGVSENDRFNHLILSAGLAWHEVRIIRAYARY